MTETTENVVTYELDGDVAIVGLNRPDKRNALSEELQTQLRAAVFRGTEEAKAGVIFGHGGNFSAGLDLTRVREWLKPGGRKPRPGGSHRSFELIARGQIPWVASLSGACIGGGLELATACHIRVADSTTFFALPEGKRGIFVGAGGTVRIQRLIGYGLMADMMLTGRVLTAAEAREARLIQYVVPAGESSLAKAKALAATIATNAPKTNWAVCSALPRISDMGHEDGLFVEGLIVNSVMGDEGYERVKAFLERGAMKVVAPGAEGEKP
ncbi:MAG: putative enoyl-CoA hydratase [Rhodospirillales bacterium]|jgi:enoyl-CoA hydratase/carnithine racemase|nr:putative enoyl-CoA hydratase [Rhodospirillales bacterium]